MQQHLAEIDAKLEKMRGWLETLNAGGLRLRGTDWFAWATGGGSNTVLLTAETGVAEILVTADEAYVLTDDIEVLRLQEEEVRGGFEWHVTQWADDKARDRFVEDLTNGTTIVSDRPVEGEMLLPPIITQQRYRLMVGEQQRYRDVGRLAAEAMTEVMTAARPDWTEYELAGAGAEALWSRGLHPALTLAAGERRLPRHRHPTPTGEKLGKRAMLVFCARGHGLIANLTRFVNFGKEQQHPDEEALRRIEAAGLQACQPGTMLSEIYGALDAAYHEQGFPEGILHHHQGGITGYLAREVVATPHTMVPLQHGMAIAFNPSLAGTKLEDTFLLQASGPEILTLDSAWPTVMQNGLPRALPLEAE